jgi:hydroxypyruvate isomerase
MLKFSANLSLLFTEKPLAERFSAARAAGFSAVEIQFPYELGISELKSLLQENELELVLINVPAGDLMQGGNGLACVPGRQAEFRAATLQAGEYAEALRVPFINILAGRQPQGIARDDCMATLLENLDHASHHFHRAGAGTVVEAINIFDMKNFLIHSLAHMQHLCAHNSHLKMQFDCYHMSRMGEDLTDALRNNLPCIGHIQFADNPGRHEPGTGRIDYAPIFSLLEKSAYAGWCGAEYHPAQSTAASLAWLEKYR